MALCQIHYWREIADRHGSRALLSRHRNTSTAIVFVHGYGGHAIDTWANFQTQIDQVNDGLSWWATSDLYFFQYQSIDDSIYLSANELISFLQQHLPAPSSSLFLPDRQLSVDFPTYFSESVALREPSEYKEIVLVGHSQGAVVIRQAVLYALELARLRFDMNALPDFYKLLFNAKLRLFSPAHGGMMLAGYAGLITDMPLVGWLFGATLRNASPSFVQLGPDSDLLTQLRIRTTSAWKDFRFNALSADIMYPSKEQVVLELHFDHDSPPTYVYDQSHTSLCKPRHGYRQPMDFIRHANPTQVAAV